MSGTDEAADVRLNRERTLQFYEDARARAGWGEKVFSDGVKSLVLLNGTAIALVSGALSVGQGEVRLFLLVPDLARNGIGLFIQGAVLVVMANALFAIASYSRGF